MKLIQATLIISSAILALTLSACSTRIPTKAPDTLETPVIRIAFGSCVSEPDSPIWKSISAKSPDLMLFLGDNVYFENVDFKNKDQLDSIYQRLFSRKDFLELLSKVPTYAIWDDHDFGPNNADSEFSDYKTTRELFKKYWGDVSNPPGLEGSLARAISIPGVRLLLTDNRTFRKNLGKKGSTMFGEAQLRWIESELAHPKDEVIIIASGGQLLAENQGFEGLYQYPKEQARLLKAISSSIATVIVLSGDRHFAEVLEVPVGEKRVFEFTSSPLSARLAPAMIDKGQPNRRAAYFGSINFGMLEIRKSKATLSINGYLYDQDGSTLLSTINRLS